MTQHVEFPGETVALTVTLIVKAADVDRAKADARQRLNAWFNDGPAQPGPDGFPYGTLLHYSFGSDVDQLEDAIEGVVERIAASMGRAEL